MPRHNAWIMLLVATLVAGACGDDAASTSTTTSVTTTTVAATTTTEDSTTTTEGTTTVPAPVAVAELCVVDRPPGETARVRTGPGVEFDLVAELPHDATGVLTTGNTALDGEGDPWTEIVYEGQARWVVSQFLTPGACNPAAGAATYAVTGIACGSQLNVRTGLGDTYEAIGALAPDAVGIAGTGIVALDGEGRTWVQVSHGGASAWVAGWYLTTDVGPTIICVPALPWLLTADGLGPIALGSQAAALGTVTAWTWTLADSYGSCAWWESNGVGVQALSGVVVEIWAMSNAVAVTPEGFKVGMSKSDAWTAFGPRGTVVPGPYAGEVIIIDAPNWMVDFTYLLTLAGPDPNLIDVIRINDDGGYIEGGCS